MYYLFLNVFRNEESIFDIINKSKIASIATAVIIVIIEQKGLKYL